MYRLLSDMDFLGEEASLPIIGTIVGGFMDKDVK